jgi:hypothetical protein
VELPSHLDVPLRGREVFVLHDGLEHVRRQPVSVHRGKTPPQVMEAIDPLALWLDASRLLDSLEFHIVLPAILVPREL